MTEELEREAARLQLEFYQELPNYEVVVDVTPVAAPERRASPPAAESESVTETGNTTAAQAAPASTPSAAQGDPTPASLSNGNFLLQAGAFQQQTAASGQLNRLLALGLDARIRQENLPGRTLYLVQAGPYDTREQMLRAESTLRSNNIDTMRITLNRP